MSRTHDLVKQIKQITIEIHDIKEKRKKTIDSKQCSNTINVHNHTLSGLLQEGHAKHDKDGIYYKDSKQTVHPAPDSKNTQEHCVPTQCPSPTKPIASPPPPPELHPSSLGSGNPSKLPSRKLLWSKSPNGPESPGIMEGNADEEGDPPWTRTNPSCDGSSNDADAECRKVGVW